MEQIQEGTLSDVLTASLELAGVKNIYGIIGDSLNPFGQAVSKSNLEWIGMRHEEAAAYAAAAQAQLSGVLGVCAGTSGPGSIHLINGLYEANRNGAPVLALVSHIMSAEIGRDYFQATHPERVFGDCSVFCEFLSHTSQVPLLIFEAIQTAIAKKGVAVLIIPGDILKAKMPMPKLHAPVYHLPTQSPQYDQVELLAQFLKQYKKPLIYCGIGCRDAMDEIKQFAQKLKAPCLYTMRSKDFAQYDNPYCVGMLGLLATGSSQTALKECDCLIMAGSDYPYDFMLPKQAAFVQIDADASHLGRRGPLDFGLAGDIKTALKMLLPLISERKDSEFLDKSLAAAKAVNETIAQKLEEAGTAASLQPQYLSNIVDKTAKEDAIFVAGVGLNDIWVNRYITPSAKRRIIGSFKHATMGAAVSEGIGACIAEPKKQVIVFEGDGGLTMNLGELLTIAQYKIPVKIIAFNNGELGFINLEAQLEGIKPFGTVLKNPDFAKLAQVIGIKSYSISSPEEARKLIPQALADEGPVLINAFTDPQAL